MSECTCGWTKGMRSVCICQKEPQELDVPLSKAMTGGRPDSEVVEMVNEMMRRPAPTITLAEPPAEPMVVTVRPAKAKVKVTPVTKPKAPKKPAKPALPKKKK